MVCTQINNIFLHSNWRELWKLYMKKLQWVFCLFWIHWRRLSGQQRLNYHTQDICADGEELSSALRKCWTSFQKPTNRISHCKTLPRYCRLHAAATKQNNHQLSRSEGFKGSPPYPYFWQWSVEVDLGLLLALSEFPQVDTVYAEDEKETQDGLIWRTTYLET